MRNSCRITANYRRMNLEQSTKTTWKDFHLTLGFKENRRCPWSRLFLSFFSLQHFPGGPFSFFLVICVPDIYVFPSLDLTEGHKTEFLPPFSSFSACDNDTVKVDRVRATFTSLRKTHLILYIRKFLRRSPVNLLRLIFCPLCLETSIDWDVCTMQ